MHKKYLTHYIIITFIGEYMARL